MGVMVLGLLKPPVIQGAALEVYAIRNVAAVRAMSRDPRVTDAADPPVRVEHPGPVGLTAVVARTF